MTTLLDANVLIALVVDDHVHHAAAETWFAGSADPFATCPITQGSLVRLLIREGQTADDAQALLGLIEAGDRHEFWPDSITYGEVPMNGILGHRQVTDAYLAHLARINAGRLVTFDQGLATLHADVVDLLPTIPAQPSR
ncbi:TA system VapC family ribonuclease toxin [Amycolatopsis pithecellobii]|uniref:Ribonuclease VapC n=1 Tax=Amycolatopsis pithecellobii TaxID=664692 RepID=A0A6N7YPD7_9PSEU|nr:TA system VapC family ribonuclease toxin [Amycolatopsis pithecellobii]MTD54867.1 PIN domain-containing protein [Amycolatopsis pithecellobii]